MGWKLCTCISPQTLVLVLPAIAYLGINAVAGSRRRSRTEFYQSCITLGLISFVLNCHYLRQLQLSSFQQHSGLIQLNSLQENNELFR